MFCVCQMRQGIKIMLSLRIESLASGWLTRVWSMEPRRTAYRLKILCHLWYFTSSQECAARQQTNNFSSFFILFSLKENILLKRFVHPGMLAVHVDFYTRMGQCLFFFYSLFTRFATFLTQSIYFPFFIIIRSLKAWLTEQIRFKSSSQAAQDNSSPNARVSASLREIRGRRG